MDAIILDADKKSAYQFSRLLYNKNIYDNLPDQYKDLYGAHELLQEIEFGNRIAVGFLNGNTLMGCVHGEFENNIFTAHLMFLRKIKVVPALLYATEILKKHLAEKGKILKFIDGFIPAHNRAAVICAYRYGAKNIGITNDVTFLCNGVELPCLHFRKEIK
jgi:hypothetical protein